MKKLLILLIIIIGIEATLLVRSNIVANKTDNSTVSKKYWENRIEIAGAKNAYSEFKNEYEGKGSATHETAHLFGDALYKKVGADGITICDNSFAFGCYHSLISNVLREKGLNSLTDLYAICLDTFGPLGTGCQHGIGHAILEYLGHKNIEKAIALCTNIQAHEYLGCSSGIFMEYNFPNGTRPFEKSTATSPCSNMPDRFRASCFYELPMWWISAQKELSPQTLADYCLKLQNKDQHSCFLGLGTTIGYSYNKEKVKSFCNNMPYERKEICFAGASWSFFSNPETQNAAKDICGELPETQYETCIVNSDLTTKTFK